MLFKNIMQFKYYFRFFLKYFIFLILLINITKFTFQSSLIYKTKYLPNSISGTGHVLRDPIYRAQCKLLSCKHCCVGIMSTYINCGSEYNCNKYSEYQSFQTYKLTLIIIGVVIFIFILFMFIGFYCSLGDTKLAIIQVCAKSFMIFCCPTWIFLILLYKCGCIKFNINSKIFPNGFSRQAVMIVKKDNPKNRACNIELFDINKKPNTSYNIPYNITNNNIIETKNKKYIIDENDAPPPN